ncbi:MAG TPA: GNAT family N-acetyltransferase [Candidatus Angelobacter sp.]|nr:GNAT family N-acetyltransferase [Candidatus Angelobacter sp.]
MVKIHYRRAETADVPALARIRSIDWGSEGYWGARISGYMNGVLHPQKALAPRIIYAAFHRDFAVGFIAGHLTRRYECDGELEWIDVIPEHRRGGIASELLRLLAVWFVEEKARKVCVDVDPANLAARRFYANHGATNLNPRWMVWKDIGVVLKAS